jgi:hypothetical protein
MFYPGVNAPPEVRWSAAWAAGLVGLAYDRFGSGVRPASWDVRLCRVCECGSSRETPPGWCWYCPTVELVEEAS